MAINPNIALSFQAPKIDDPLNKLAQMEQIKAYRQNALAKQMEMDAAVREREMTNALRQRLASGKQIGMEEALSFGTPGIKAFKEIAEINAQQEAEKANRAKFLGEMVKQYSGALAGVASRDQYASLYNSAIEQVPEWKSTWVPPEQWTQEWNDRTVAGAEGVIERLKASLKPPSDKPKSQKNVVVGGRIVNPATGEVIYESPEEDKPPTDWKPEVGEGGAVEYFSPSTGRRVRSTGTPVGGTPSDKPLNETQGKATAFGMRMKEANKILTDLEDMELYTPSYVRSAAEEVPLIGGGLGAAAGYFSENENEQMIRQARENFITAVLRQESGAAISDQEFNREERKYFPQAGDSKNTIAQKRRARELAIKAMSIQAGPGGKSIEEFNPEGVPKEGGGKSGYLGIFDNDN